MRTNIEIDDELMRQAMAATGAATKKAAVEACLRKLIDVKAREKESNEAMKRREEDRQTAVREGRLEQWYAELLAARAESEEKIEELAHAD